MNNGVHNNSRFDAMSESDRRTSIWTEIPYQCKILLQEGWLPQTDRERDSKKKNKKKKKKKKKNLSQINI